MSGVFVPDFDEHGGLWLALDDGQTHLRLTALGRFRSWRGARAVAAELLMSKPWRLARLVEQSR